MVHERLFEEKPEKTILVRLSEIRESLVQRKTIDEATKEKHEQQVYSKQTRTRNKDKQCRDICTCISNKNKDESLQYKYLLGERGLVRMELTDDEKEGQCEWLILN
jgi:hypothetical protein